MSLDAIRKPWPPCEQAIRLDTNPLLPVGRLAYEAKVLALHGLGHYEEVLIAFNQASTNSGDTYLALGSMLHALGRYEEALTTSEQAIRSILYHDKKQASRAISSYEREGIMILSPIPNVLELNQELLATNMRTKPKLALAYCNMGLVFNVLGRYEEALVACEQAIRLDFALALAYTVKNNALKHLGH